LAIVSRLPIWKMLPRWTWFSGSRYAQSNDHCAGCRSTVRYGAGAKTRFLHAYERPGRPDQQAFDTGANGGLALQPKSMLAAAK
jgi:hypothetical protein